jgi:hypothetical protein
VLIISDACFSAAMIPLVNPPSPDLQGLTSRQILTSGSFQEVPAKSYFTQRVLEVLEQNDLNPLSALRLYGKILDDVMSHTNKQPLLLPFGENGILWGQFNFYKKAH